MAILVLNKRPLRATSYHTWLRGVTEDLYLFTCEKNQGPGDIDAVRQCYRGVEVFPNYDLNGNVFLRALELHEKDPISRIVALSEVDIVRAAELRQRLGIAGQDTVSALAYRDKLIMKRLLRKGGIPVAACASVESPLDILAFEEEHGLPYVIKPRRGGGSVGVHVIRERRDLEALLAAGLSHSFESDSDLMIEQYIEGTVHHIDGLIDEGAVSLCWPSVYWDSPLSFNDNRTYGGATLAADNPLCTRMRELVTRVIEVLPSPGKAAFHAEVFHTPDDELYLCEIASRAGGGGVPAVVKTAFDIDMNQYAAMHQAGMHAPVPDTEGGPKRLAAWVLIPPRPGTLAQVPDVCELPGVVQQAISARPGQTLGNAKNSVDKMALFIVVADNETDLLQRCHEVRDWFESNCTWEN